MFADMLDNFMDLFDLDDLPKEPDDGLMSQAGGQEQNSDPVLVDLDGDGIPDMVVQQQGLDLDGDGILETQLVNQAFDLDGDGIIDAQRVSVGVDGDLDGVADLNVDTVAVDLDGDGLADYQQMGMDLDGDGVFERLDQFVDLDGDGVFDMAHTAMDTDGDGRFDAFQMTKDLDGDGVFHGVELAPDDREPQADDQNRPDDQDGQIFDDEAEPFYEPEPQAEVEPQPDPGYGAVPNFEPFDPDEADPDKVIGDPESAMENWHWQETGSSCAVASQEFVLEELTGQEFEESDLRDLAEANGWYMPQAGTPMDDVGNILEHMGLDVERSQGNSIDDIAQCLQDGGQVIVAVDSSELWEGVNDDNFGPGMQADHAVQVIGIDYTDPDEPMVILNDPGASNGGGAQVPLDEFMDAWEDSGCYMVEAYA